MLMPAAEADNNSIHMLFLNFPSNPYKVGTVISILFIYEGKEASCSNLSRVTHR